MIHLVQRLLCRCGRTRQRSVGTFCLAALLLGVSVNAVEWQTPSARPSSVPATLSGATVSASQGCSSSAGTVAASPGQTVAVTLTYPLTPTAPFTAPSTQRSFLVHLPRSYSGAPTPLVVNLHGFSGTAAGQEVLTGMSVTADRDGFIVAYPQGTLGQSGYGQDSGQYGWNVYDPGQVASAWHNVDDVGFIDAVRQAIESNFCVDTDREGLTGFSLGATMTWHVACDGATWMRAIAPVNGPTPQYNLSILGATPCFSRGIGVMAFEGLRDPLAPAAYVGSSVSYYTGAPISSTIGALAYTAGQIGTGMNCLAPTVPFSSSEIYEQLFTGCGAPAAPWIGGNDSALFVVPLGGHGWPGSATAGFGCTTLPVGPSGLGTTCQLDASEVIAQFLISGQTQPALGVATATPAATPSTTPLPSATATPSTTPSPSTTAASSTASTASATAVLTAPSATATITPAASPTPPATVTPPSFTPSPSATAIVDSATPTSSATPTAVATPSTVASATSTPIIDTSTASATAPASPTATATASVTATGTASPTATATPQERPRHRSLPGISSPVFPAATATAPPSVTAIEIQAAATSEAGVPTAAIGSSEALDGHFPSAAVGADGAHARVTQAVGRSTVTHPADASRPLLLQVHLSATQRRAAPLVLTVRSVPDATITLTIWATQAMGGKGSTARLLTQRSAFCPRSGLLVLPLSPLPHRISRPPHLRIVMRIDARAATRYSRRTIVLTLTSHS